jgi:hypothetical protein
MTCFFVLFSVFFDVLLVRTGGSLTSPLQFHVRVFLRGFLKLFKVCPIIGWFFWGFSFLVKDASLLEVLEKCFWSFYGSVLKTSSA